MKTLPLISNDYLSNPLFSLLLSILKRNSRTNGWIYSNFYNLHINLNDSDNNLLFCDKQILYQCPVITNSHVPIDFLKSLNITVKDFIVKIISTDYSYILCDILKTQTEKILIYGYDTDKDLIVYKYINKFNENYQTMSFDDLSKNLVSDNLTVVRWTYWIDSKFDKGNVLEKINDFLDGKISDFRKPGVFYMLPDDIVIEKSNYVYGVKCFEYILNLIKRNKITESSLIRLFETLIDFLMLLSEKIVYIINNMGLNDEKSNEESANYIRVQNLHKKAKAILTLLLSSDEVDKTSLMNFIICLKEELINIYSSIKLHLST